MRFENKTQNDQNELKQPFFHRTGNHCGKGMGYYTQLVWQDTTHVGCGWTQFQERNTFRKLRKCLSGVNKVPSESFNNPCRSCNFLNSANAVSRVPLLLRELLGVQLRPLGQHLQAAGLRHCQQHLQLPVYRVQPRDRTVPSKL